MWQRALLSPSEQITKALLKQRFAVCLSRKKKSVVPSTSYFGKKEKRKKDRQKENKNKKGLVTNENNHYEHMH